MEIRCSIDGDIIKVTFFGELDEFGARNIKDEIDGIIDNTLSFRAMVFDFKNVTFVDSTGLGFILTRYKKLKARRAELLLKNVPKAVDRVFKASGVYKFIPTID